MQELSQQSRMPTKNTTADIDPLEKGPMLLLSAGTSKGPLAGLLGRCKEVVQLLQESSRYCIELFWERWYLRITILVVFIAAVVSAALNLVAVPLVNLQALGGLQAATSQILKRKVVLGRLHGVSLLGVSGIVPLLRMGPVMVHLEAPEVAMHQGNTFSWAGYPEDTTPSSRDYLPGLLDFLNNNSITSSSAGGPGEEGGGGGGPGEEGGGGGGPGEEGGGGGGPGEEGGGGGGPGEEGGGGGGPGEEGGGGGVSSSDVSDVGGGRVSLSTSFSGSHERCSSHKLVSPCDQNLSPAPHPSTPRASSSLVFLNDGMMHLAAQLEDLLLHRLFLRLSFSASDLVSPVRSGCRYSTESASTLLSPSHEGCSPSRDTGQSLHDMTPLPLASMTSAGGLREAELLLDDSVPPVALGRLSMRNGRLGTLMFGDSEPRWWEYVTGTLSIGRAYRELDLLIEGEAHERSAFQARCTMTGKNKTPLVNADYGSPSSASSKRHLRHVTPGAAAAAAAAGRPLKLFGCDVLPQGVRAGCVLMDAVRSRSSDPPSANDGMPSMLQYQPSVSIAENCHAASGPGLQVKDESLSSSLNGDRYTAAGTLVQTLPKSPCTHNYLYGENHRKYQSGVSMQQLSYGILQKAREGREGRATMIQHAPPEASLKPSTLSHMEQDFLHAQGAAVPSSIISPEELLRQEIWQPFGFRPPWEELEEGDVLQEDISHSSEALSEQQQLPAGASVSQDGRKPVSTNQAVVKGRGPQPKGGHVTVTLRCSDIGLPDRRPNLFVSIRGADLHGPLVERTVELPMDVYEGRVGGELRIKSYDDDSWMFPEIYGLVRCRGASFHFWDAPDEISGADMDLVFEGDRMYLHGAQGHFGAVPLRVTGDMDLNPATGSYRLSATVSGVELNALRATLGVRPVPQSVAGSLRGVMHCTGPLEKPVFSGSAVAIRPSLNLLDGLEDTPAMSALTLNAQAVAAFDKVPVLAASGVFTMDLASEMFTLHSAQVQPVGGGQAIGSGTMWLAPEAETHPEAISMRADAAGVDPDVMLQYYLPEVGTSSLPNPASMCLLGKATATITMSGSHLSPVVDVSMAAPASGTTGKGPAASFDATALISIPDIDKARAADTQREATYFSQPRFEGGDVDLSLAAVDILPLMVPEGSAQLMDPVTGGPPLRARISLNTKMSLRPSFARRLSFEENGSISLSDSDSREGPRGTDELLFEGPISINGARINQLDLIKQINGNLSLSKSKLSVRSLPPSANGASLYSASSQGGINDLNFELAIRDVEEALNLRRHPPSQNVNDCGCCTSSSYIALVSHPSSSEAAGHNMSASELNNATPLSAVASGKKVDLRTQASVDTQGDSHFMLNCGPLSVCAEAYDEGSEFHVKVMNLQLDELEVGSLRGKVLHAQLDSDIQSKQGHAAVQFEGLRYANLVADSFSSSVRWQGDIVKLEETVLTQKNSRYQVQGEFFVPDLFSSTTVAPKPVLSPALGPNQALSQAPSASLLGSNADSSTKPCNGSGGPPGQGEDAPPQSHLHHESGLIRNEGTETPYMQLLSSSWSAASEASATGAPHHQKVDPEDNLSSNHTQILDDGCISNSGPFSAEVDRPAIEVPGKGQRTAENLLLTEDPTNALLSPVLPPASAGRWRIEVTVPQADVQDVLPAAQLLSTSLGPGRSGMRDYGASKGLFISSLADGSCDQKMEDLRFQVDSLNEGIESENRSFSSSSQESIRNADIDSMRLSDTGGSLKQSSLKKLRQDVLKQAAGVDIAAASNAGDVNDGCGGDDGFPSESMCRISENSNVNAAGLPGIQDLQGSWGGRVEAFGGPTGVTSLEFALHGETWRWGAYRLDNLVARGTADSKEGLSVEELSLRSGPARLLLAGNLLCPRQQAEVHVTDFPLDLLQPMYQALPALQSAAAAAESRSRGKSMLRPFAALSRRLEASLQSMGLNGNGNRGKAQPLMLGAENGTMELGPASGSMPVLPASALSGNLYLEGRLGGSLMVPEGEVDARIERAALGATELKQAEARLVLDSQQKVTASLDLVPLGIGGHVRLRGEACLPAAVKSRLQPKGNINSSSDGESGKIFQGTERASPQLTSSEDEDMHPGTLEDEAHNKGGSTVHATLQGQCDLLSTQALIHPEASPLDVALSDDGLPQGGIVPQGLPKGEIVPQGLPIVADSDEETNTLAAMSNTNGLADCGGCQVVVPLSGGTEALSDKIPLAPSAEVAGYGDVKSEADSCTQPGSSPDVKQTSDVNDATVQITTPPSPLDLESCRKYNEPTRRSSNSATNSSPKADAMQESDASTRGADSYNLNQADLEEVDMKLSIKDGGMALLFALVPDCEWLGGQASVDVRVHGSYLAPAVDGRASMSKGQLLSQHLRYPVSNLSASVKVSLVVLVRLFKLKNVWSSLSLPTHCELPGDYILIPHLSGYLEMHLLLCNKVATIYLTHIQMVLLLCPCYDLPHAYPDGVAFMSLLQFDGQNLIAERVTADVGKQSSIHLSGQLPLHGDQMQNQVTDHQGQEDPLDMNHSAVAEKRGRGGLLRRRRRSLEGRGIRMEVEGLELKIRNVYTGALDATLCLDGSLASPQIGGWLRFSRGTAFLVPTGQVPAPSLPQPPQQHKQGTAASDTGRCGVNGARSAGAGPRPPSDKEQLVHSVFSLLKAGRRRAMLSTLSGAGGGMSAVMLAVQQQQQAAALGAPSAGPAALRNLTVRLGPDFKIFFPVVLNMQLGGNISFTGPADPAKLTAAGEVTFESGTLNLVATQFTLDREHSNRIVFSSEQGMLDPMLDVVLISGDLRASVQGRGSTWQDSIILSASGTTISGGPGASGGGRSTETNGLLSMEPSLVARVFEDRLAEALLGEDGQLALRSLASSTFSTLLPKIETRGQMGAASWRLVGAPSLPNLLGALDPFTADSSTSTPNTRLDPYKLLSSLAVGTELEVQWGPHLQASLSHKMRDNGSDVGTEATLTYRINNYLKLLLHLPHFTKPSLLLQYSSDGMPS
ncbi:hypothetical protein CEUSTIGMA_g3435.t1 [Chlamydomonas eustigma]|uniref:Translocation and assembly module TamB C-terminal domain-containing protein n=1 Tax=Chlamydomonas eustigma TaxID=1157962 RepID=A0A250WZF0_9CHLO|nr:hypothetical protein CEUSTIGMA_g3435.t1 [Chlamydomonas eustigma]|eukprot:GAX75992.1 hypothetical protein CEUSTIGMA_g3435.t1 [Chlamydomonas eustigma]